MNSTEAVWVAASLEPEQMGALEESLGIKLLPEQINQLGEILVNTANAEKHLDKLVKNLSKTETKNETQLVLNNLNHIIKTLHGLPNLSENHLNTCYWQANGYQDRHLPESNVKDFLLKAVEMKNAVEKMNQHPLPTNRKDHKYTDSLNCIADRFIVVFPEKKISSSTNSIFYKLIKYWHQHVLCSGIKSVERQIKALVIYRKKNTTT
jgi:hypothetical protein